MNILIVDDHILFRETLINIFDRQQDFRVVGEASSVREAITKALELKPEVILMDFSLPDGTGLEATKAILSELPETKIIFLTIHEEDDRLLAAVRSGAKGYLLKNIPTPRLLSSLRALQQGEAPIAPKLVGHLLDEIARTSSKSYLYDPLLQTLTQRELEVLRELSDGSSNQQIAQHLVISENTVKNHVHNILDKLKLSSRREAAIFAAKNGIGSQFPTR